MSQPLDLAKLLAEVGRARSPLKRLRLLAQGWRALKGLGRDERIEVARSAGLMGFEELLERLGHGGPEEAEALREVLEAAEEIHPSRAAETMRALRDPIRRKELVRRGAAVLTETLAREKDARGRETSPSAPRPDERAAEAASSSWAAATTTPGMPAPAAPAAAPVIVQVSAPPAVPILAARPPDHVVPEPEGASTGEIAAAGPALKEHTEELSAPPAGPAGEGRVRRPRAMEPSAALLVRGSAAPVGGGAGPAPSLLRRIEGARSLVGRFRILREAIASGERPEGEHLDRLLARFAPGWQRRRALATILRAGLPAILDEALERIEALERPRDRAWCLRALAEGRDLDEQDLRRIAGASASGAHGRGAG